MHILVFYGLIYKTTSRISSVLFSPTYFFLFFILFFGVGGGGVGVGGGGDGVAVGIHIFMCVFSLLVYMIDFLRARY